ncbi:MAG: VCBS repeat-containing protein [Planctomycetota bacterium]
MPASKRGAEYLLIALLVVALGGVVWTKLDREAPPKVPDVEPPPMKVVEPRVVPEVGTMGYDKQTYVVQGGTWRGRPAVGDVNGDGLADIVACNRLENGLNVFLQQSDGTWKVSNEGIPDDLSYGGIALGDVDEDGDPDIVFTTHKAPVHVLLNDSKAHWTVSNEGLKNADVTNAVALGDLTGDGHLDIVAVAQFKGGLFVWHGDGKGKWEADTNPTSMQAYQGIGKFGTDVKLADIDGDGDLDILALMELGLKPLCNDGHGVFTLEQSNLPSPTIGGSLFAVCAGDLDGDRYPEVVVGGGVDPTKEIGIANRGMSVFKLDRETGQWLLAGKGLDPREVCHDVALADMDADGKLDLVTASIDRKVTFWRGGGKGGFTESARIPGAERRGRLVLADLNGKGALEVLTVSTENGAVDYFSRD